MPFVIRNLFSNLPPLTFAAALDILILSLVIYQILLLIKGLGTAQFLVWTALLAAVYYGARWGQLQVITWLLGTLFPYLLFGLLVLFQAEIRRWLARISRNPFGTPLSSFEARHVSEDILMAVTRLSAERIGALIVLERETALRTYTESGIPLQARISHDLLLTIFQRRAPLHDGAVILRKDKVVAAACFLPLSVNPIWGTQLGTRHRAAVGITEETDAVAIAVSEETGAISLAVSGSIEVDISIERLAERLGELFGHPAPSMAALPKPGLPFEESSPARAGGAATHEPR
ncbi:MAG: TIGR00159 family protein [Acidobacteria bacterium RIFCSPLOWO2_02_FULL_60_20]|nr:MAG: TIGR00159 family protein [Acidobacteria bacterium RIFCSPLOWO2_02_FULL_60_20]